MWFDGDVLNLDTFKEADSCMAGFVNRFPVSMWESANPLPGIVPVLAFGQVRLGYRIDRGLCNGVDVVLPSRRVAVNRKDIPPGPLVAYERVRRVNHG